MDEYVKCPIHGVKAKKREKDGDTWFSHKHEDGWCSSKDWPEGWDKAVVLPSSAPKKSYEQIRTKLLEIAMMGSQDVNEALTNAERMFMWVTKQQRITKQQKEEGPPFEV